MRKGNAKLWDRGAQRLWLERRKKMATDHGLKGVGAAGAVDSSSLMTSTQVAECNGRETVRSNSTVSGELTSTLLLGLLFTD